MRLPWGFEGFVGEEERRGEDKVFGEGFCWGRREEDRVFVESEECGYLWG